MTREDGRCYVIDLLVGIVNERGDDSVRGGLILTATVYLLNCRGYINTIYLSILVGLRPTTINI